MAVTARYIGFRTWRYRPTDDEALSRRDRRRRSDTFDHEASEGVQEHHGPSGEQQRAERKHSNGRMVGHPSGHEEGNEAGHRSGASTKKAALPSAAAVLRMLNVTVRATSSVPAPMVT